MARQRSGIDSMPGLSRSKTSPVPVVRTRRQHDLRVLTSFPAGKMCPITAFPLLREDALQMSRFRINFEMMETAEILMNAVNVNVKAYLVPHLAFERFNGLDHLNRSYMGQPDIDGGSVTPYFVTETAPADMTATNRVLQVMGMHAKAGDTINTAYNEAYNTIWNFRAKNRSPDITLRSLTDKTLAPAFWQHQQFRHVVPDFDQALIDGEVPLTVANGKLPILGMGFTGAAQTPATTYSYRNAKGVSVTTPQGAGTVGTYNVKDAAGPLGAYNQQLQLETRTGSFPNIWAELEENGITVSLANVEMARKTQAFAVLRKQYSGHDDDYIIDMLMQGLTVPEQAWRQPILLADRSSIFGMSKRYATDSTDLTASVANGASFIDLAITCPRCPTGGVIMITAEVTPEQLYERQANLYLHTTTVASLPDYLRDTLDPEKVEIVTNKAVDVMHSTPSGTFGYAPLNWRWNQYPPQIGGKFYRPAVDDPFDEDRMRMWSVETANPTLAADFYLCTNIHQKVFVVTNQDPFEVVMRGIANIDGNTVFGHALIEASDDYSQVMGEAPIDRIDKPVSLEAEGTEDELEVEA